MLDYSQLTTLQLLQIQATVEQELRERLVIRTGNILGDYAEWLVAQKLNLQLVNNSKSGFDAFDQNQLTYQIKARRITSPKASRQLSAIRNLEHADFHYLIAVLFDKDFSILQAFQISYQVVHAHARYQKHTNAHILHLRGAILSHEEVFDITERLK